MAVAAEVACKTEIARVLRYASSAGQDAATILTATRMTRRYHVADTSIQSARQLFSCPLCPTIPTLRLVLTPFRSRYRSPMKTCLLLLILATTLDAPAQAQPSPQATQPQAAQGRGAAEAAIPKWTPTTSRPRLDAAMRNTQGRIDGPNSASEVFPAPAHIGVRPAQYDPSQPAR